MTLNQQGGWKLVKMVKLNHKTDVYIELKVALVDSTSPKLNVDMSAFGRAVEKSVKVCYEVLFHDVRYEFPAQTRSFLDNYSYLNNRPVAVPVIVQVHVDVKWRVLGKRQTLSGEHLIEVKSSGEMPGLYGETNYTFGSEICISARYVANIISGYDKNTVPHELGHSLGLLHPDDNYHVLSFVGFESEQYWGPRKQLADTNNLMFNGESPYMNDSLSVHVSPEQIRRIVNNLKAGRVNK